MDDDNMDKETREMTPDNSNPAETIKRLREDKKTAEAAMEAKSRFLANMSHEIRTPIQTIIGITELLQNTRLDQEQAEYARQIQFSADVLLSLINDILDFSKIEAGKMEIEHIDFNLDQAVEQAVDMIALEAHKKGLEIAVDISPELALVVRGDPNKFRQIVINLVKNAVKFTKEGEVTISARPACQGGKEAVRVAVADTGIGVPEQARSRLFSTFFQADPSNTRTYGGTGLGLAISHDLVTLMGGCIEMVPNQGGGSIFRFTLPIEKSALPSPPLPAAQNRDMRILVTDDRPETCRIITAYLHEIGWQNTDAAHSGEEALLMLRAAAAANRHYELCLIDMIMPRMDGWRLGAEIINDQSINNSRLILMIPHGLLKADAKMTLLKWFNAYINKPITRRALAKIIPLALEDTVETLETEREDTAPEAEAPGTGHSAAGSLAAGRPLILVAEDHPVNQKLFGVILEKLGYPSVLADDGQDALEKAAVHPVSLIFMDIQMPRMNGYEAAAELRKRGFNGPLVAVTASALAGERERCKQAGFNDILLKPFRRPDIEEMLQKWGESAGGTSAPPAPAGPPAPEEGAAEKPAEPAAPMEPAASVKPAVFDRREALESFLGNAEMVKSLLVRFFDRTEAALDAIGRCLGEKDQDEGRREAHTIKGSALTLGGKELGAAAAKLELAFKNAEFGEAETLAPLLTDAFGRFKAEAETFIKGGES